jgi:hypothetical protein
MRREECESSMTQDRLFVVVSGLPGSGKSTLARRLSPLLRLKVIDKDDILEHLAEERGIGDGVDWTALGQESDLRLQAAAHDSEGALLVSFWHVPGMASASGTPTHWLTELSSSIVNLHCSCEPQTALQRLLKRGRGPGRDYTEASGNEVLADLQLLAELGPPGIGRRVEVDTSHPHTALKTLVKSIFYAYYGVHPPTH